MKTEKQLIEEGVITALIIRRLNKFIDEFFEFDYLEGRLEAKALQISRRGRLVELELMYEEHLKRAAVSDADDDFLQERFDRACNMVKRVVQSYHLFM
jgi:hypothetical protein